MGQAGRDGPLMAGDLSLGEDSGRGRGDGSYPAWEESAAATVWCRRLASGRAAGDIPCRDMKLGMEHPIVHRDEQGKNDD